MPRLALRPAARSASRARPCPSQLRPDPDLAAAMESYLLEHHPSRKPPVVAAAVLALIVELDRTSQPFPRRRQVADALRCSVYGIDAAISVALSRGLLSVEVDVLPGHVEQRDSSICERRYVPSDRLPREPARSATVSKGRRGFSAEQNIQAA